MQQLRLSEVRWLAHGHIDEIQILSSHDMLFLKQGRTAQYAEYSESEAEGEHPDLHMHTYRQLLRAQTVSSFSPYFQGPVYPSTDGLLAWVWIEYERIASPPFHQLWLCDSTSWVMRCWILIEPQCSATSTSRRSWFPVEGGFYFSRAEICFLVTVVIANWFSTPGSTLPVRQI